MNCRTPDLPVHHQPPESTQTHVHWVGDAIQPSYPLSSLLPHASTFTSTRVLLMSQLLASGGQSFGASVSASVLSKNIQGWFPLGLTGLIPLLSKGLSWAFSSTTFQKHQFFCAQLALGIQHNDSVSHIYIFLYRLSLCRLLQNIECRCLCYTVGPSAI